LLAETQGPTASAGSPSQPSTGASAPAATPAQETEVPQPATAPAPVAPSQPQNLFQVGNGESLHKSHLTLSLLFLSISSLLSNSNSNSNNISNISNRRLYPVVPGHPQSIWLRYAKLLKSDSYEN
jgi:hypothetical protein